MMLKVAPAADAGRALFVGRRRMSATILRWLTIIVHLVRNLLVIPAKAGISMPLPRPLKTREIPAFAGMTTKDRQAGKRDGFGSAARRSTVFHPYLRSRSLPSPSDRNRVSVAFAPNFPNLSRRPPGQ